MAIGSNSRQNSFAIKEENRDDWDPYVILEIINPDTRGFTCVGHAPSKGRRCQNPINRGNREAVFAMLDRIALLSPSSSRIRTMLPKIASLSLCRAYHQGQADSVTAQWQAKILTLRRSAIRTNSWRVYEEPSSSRMRPFGTASKTTAQTPQPFEEGTGESAWTARKNNQPRTSDERFYQENECHKRREQMRFNDEELSYKEESSNEEELNSEEELSDKEENKNGKNWKHEREEQAQIEKEKKELQRIEQKMKEYTARYAQFQMVAQRRREEQERKEKERKEQEKQDRAAQNERIRLRARRMREEQDRREQEMKEQEMKEQERKEQERKEHERKKQERKEQERKEQERKEQERKEQERKDQERKDQERKEQERKDQNERIRLAAQKKREEKERQARELAAKEKKEWEESWTTFSTRWTTFKEIVLLPVTKSSIPWPVKTGRYADLNASNVRDFYRKACPDAASPALMFKAMQAESLKWHPDKAAVLFPGFTVGAAEREVLLMICRAVLELRREANGKREATPS